MSYCRFSSDDFACDVYVYEHCEGGWTTHVASRRVVGDVPKLPALTADNESEYFAAYHAQIDFMKTAEHEDIGLPHDGESFSDDTPGECADRLESLRAMGYNVPQSAIDALRQEHAESQGPGCKCEPGDCRAINSRNCMDWMRRGGKS